jgi:hypothetical protein
LFVQPGPDFVLARPATIFQRAKEEKLLLNILKNRRHLWIGHIIRHNEFAVNILERVISGGKSPWEDLDYNS